MSPTLEQLQALRGEREHDLVWKSAVTLIISGLLGSDVEYLRNDLDRLMSAIEHEEKVRAYKKALAEPERVA